MLFMLSEYEMILRLALAALLGGLIGFERERLSWAAGLRTHMLVCLGSALVMLVSQYAFHEVVQAGLINLDPSRMAAQVVSGIGFLGAGTIIFQKNVVRGLTTAASVWAVAAVGLGVGGGLYVASISTTVMILVILAGLKPIERRFLRKNFAIGVRFSAHTGFLSTAALQNLISDINVRFGATSLHIEKIGEKELFYLTFRATSASKFSSVVDELRKIQGIDSIELVNEISEIS